MSKYEFREYEGTISLYVDDKFNKGYHDLAFCFDKEEWTLLKYGEYKNVSDWFEKKLERLKNINNTFLARNWVIISRSAEGKEKWNVDLINKFINISGFIGKWHRKQNVQVYRAPVSTGKMFEYLKEYKKIVVSGPQRSGTTICAKMIASDLCYTCLLEETFSTNYNWGDFQRLFKSLLKDNCKVCQIPALSPYLHLLPEDVAVIFMMRDIEDIKISEKRINWTDEQRMLSRYYRTSGNISETKYEVWKEYQKPFIKHAYEIPYESLKEHPMWVDKKNRINFGPRQTEIEEL